MTAENPTGRSDETETATVVNMKNRPDLRAALDGADEHGDVVRIDRRTRWGNPFLIGRHGSREEVIERYRAWLWGKLRKGEIQVAELAALNGKTLACHCAPLPCHGDVLVKAAAWAQARIAPGMAQTAREAPQEGRTRAPVYAGVGARRTPTPVLASMRDMARELAAHGWHLRTGGAAGADSAFARAAPAGQRTVFIPWQGYNRWDAAGCRLLGADEIGAMREAAAAHHPAWERCSESVRNLHARNVAVLLGADMGQAVDAMVCWTDRGRVSGGTGMAIRLARHHGIPVLNLAETDPREAMSRLEGIAASVGASFSRRSGGRERALPGRSGELDGSGERRSQETASRPRLRHEARSRGRGLSM